ncbi:unnamed protein product [Oncorhynchus mykiss]|uniref:Uncharacterized protein n=1 Tax=Oncorhynchus mykiss TaxID=8022 RepID=A0A060YKK2_ONCMY|nr:unnamed protein product [Oncorhynchus mykiss]
MAANIEQIFRDFVVNKIKEIEDESQDIILTDEGHPNGKTAEGADGINNTQGHPWGSPRKGVDKRGLDWSRGREVWVHRGDL